MNRNNRDKAREFASRPYSVRVSKDMIGKQQVFMAENLELPGCMAQGETIKQAIQELEEARFEYILSLLDDGRDVPLPFSQRTATSGGSATSVTEDEVVGSVEADFSELLTHVAKKVDREAISTTSEVS